MSDGIRLEELGLPDAAREVSREWPGFRTRAGVTPFLEPDYLLLWARTIGRLEDCRAVVAQRLGELVGFGPFMVSEETVGPFSVPCLRFIGNNVGYPGDVLYSDIAAASPRGPIVGAILQRASHWRVGAWDLGFLPPWSETSTLAPPILGERTDGHSLEHQNYAGLTLPPTWDDFLRRLSGNVRRCFRRRLQRLGELGETEVRIARAPEPVRQRAIELLANHERWARGTEREAWFARDRVKRFLVEASELLAAKGEFLAFALEVDGEPIAWNMGAHDGVRYFEQVISYDRTYRAYAPGALLGILAVRDLINLGTRRIELGPGLDERKQALGGDTTAYGHLRGFHGWLRSLVAVRNAYRRRRAPA